MAHYSGYRIFETDDLLITLLSGFKWGNCDLTWTPRGYESYTGYRLFNRDKNNLVGFKVRYGKDG